MKFDPNQFAFEMLKVMASEEHQNLFPSAPRIKIASEEEIAVPLQYSLDAINDVADEIVNSGAGSREVVAGLVGLSEHLESLGQEEGAEVVLRKLATLQGGWTPERQEETNAIEEDDIINALESIEVLPETEINRPYQRAVSNYGIQQNADDGEGEDDLVDKICSILGKYIKDDEVCEKLAKKLIKLFDSEDKNDSSDIDSDLNSARIMQMINQELAGVELTPEQFSEIADAIKSSKAVDLSGMAPLDPNYFANTNKLPKHVNLHHKAVDAEHDSMFPYEDHDEEEPTAEELKEIVAYRLTKQIIKVAKENAKAKVRNRPAPIFDAKSPKIKDNKDHFPIDTIGRARNALARVEQFDAAPPWWKGSLSELKNAVKRAVKAKYPSIAVGGKKDSNDARGSQKKTQSERTADLKRDKAGQPIGRTPSSSSPRRMVGVKPDTLPRPKKGDKKEPSPTRVESVKEIFDSAMRSYDISGSVSSLGDAIDKLKDKKNSAKGKKDHTIDEYINKLQKLLDDGLKVEEKTDSKDSPGFPNIKSFARSIKHDVVQYKALTKEYKTQERLDEIDSKISGLERMVKDFCEENADNEKSCNVLKEILENIKNIAPKSDTNDADERAPLADLARDLIYTSDYDEHKSSTGVGAGVQGLHDEKGRIINPNLVNILENFVLARKARKGSLARQFAQEFKNKSGEEIQDLVSEKTLQDIEKAIELQLKRKDTPSRVTSTDSNNPFTSLIDAARTYKGSNTEGHLKALENAALIVGRELSKDGVSYKELTGLEAVDELNRVVVKICGISVKPKILEGLKQGPRETLERSDEELKADLLENLEILSRQISQESDFYKAVKSKAQDKSTKSEAERLLSKMNKLRSNANTCIQTFRKVRVNPQEFKAAVELAEKTIPEMKGLISIVKTYLGIEEPVLKVEKPVRREILLKDLQARLDNLLESNISEQKKEKLRTLQTQMITAEFEGDFPIGLFEKAINDIEGEV